MLTVVFDKSGQIVRIYRTERIRGEIVETDLQKGTEYEEDRREQIEFKE